MSPLRQAWMHLLLLWLAANALRMTVLAVPPVLPAIHRDLHLSEAAVGALTGLPLVLLSIGAVFGSLLVARWGARRALILGLCLLGVAGAARGLGHFALILFGMTFLMGAGIAVSQPALPSLVRAWFPDRVGRATAVYSNGFLIGETVAASLTVPLILPLVNHSWELAFAVWSLPVGLAALAIALLTRHEQREPGALPVSWWPDWRSGLTWRLGLVLGCASLAYFGSNAFLPDFLKATHHSGLTAAALTSLNFSQVPASILAAIFPRQVIGRRWPFVVAGAIVLLSAFGYHMGGVWTVIWAGTLGFSTALVFVLCLALPPLLTDADDVHRLTAAMFTITYACPFVGAFIGGALWDASGVPALAFVAVGGAGVVMAALVYGLDLSGLSSGPRAEAMPGAR